MQSRVHLSILFLLSATYLTPLQSNPAAARATLTALRQSPTQVTRQARRHLSQIKASGEEITNAVQLGRALQKSRIKNSLASLITGLLAGIIAIEETIYKGDHEKWEEKYRAARTKTAQLYGKVFNSKQEPAQEKSLGISEEDEHPREQEEQKTCRTRDDEESATPSRAGEQILELKRKLSQEFVNLCQTICSKTRQSGASELTVSRVNQMIAAFQIQFDSALNTAQSEAKLNALYEEYFGAHGKVAEVKAHVQTMLASGKKKETK